MRRGLRIVLVLALAAGAFYVIDLLVTSGLEQRVAHAIGEATAGEAAVSLHGWPVAVRVLAGSVPRADVTVLDADLPDAPARLRTLEATLFDVEVDWRGDPFVHSARDGRLVATFDDIDLDEARLRSLRLVLPSVGGSLVGLEDPAVPFVVQAPGGRFEAELTNDDINAMLGVPGLDLEVEEGHVRLRVGPVGVDAAAEVSDGAILLRPRQPLLGLVLRELGPLRLRPELPPTARLEDIELRAGAVRLHGSVQRLELPAAAR